MQGDLRTVQGVLTNALNRIEGAEIVLYGSGRTDAGVHAEAQVANVVLQREISPEKLKAAVNGNVPNDVRVIDVKEVEDEFHARYSAKEKTYIYRIVNGRVISPFWFRYACHEARPLNLELMKESAKLFIGSHDWTAFSSAQTDSESRVRNITQLELSERCDRRVPGRMIEIKVSADGFLRYMVRSIAGTLMAVGRREIDGHVVQRAIDSGDRSLAATTAPACGLSLVSVRYDQ